ncbi:hypothetical protein SAR03_08690 [Staphylococcus arlettae]|uniref:Uncharacterized protein n=1 Tax=Staphylococcus arlettae TaxID=29378 RepID=A0ABQ0XUR7_9STAP|nr:hypothetical protein N039_07465 [Staphylococcus sp. EGD-HP3]GEP99831.1 hypothetical protein SAR03_08690 [Staphylococcus arlettae]
MFLEKLKCNKCQKEINNNENITIYTNTKNLNGITNLKSWAKLQKVLCEACSK